ncbi:hypothetical protein [Thalassomonas actiniarum]|uniref:Uncharacterized protein n=1 Tax=Thalassomonas actiniarum TaxID=485447 RepID=A0AAE9YTM4_9GAMM|nr:hypothetical protein [Thalassomonas actiniarum]WDD99287.1 hypothetical protein SG35_000940 [Thalassomonas actiniarum]
MKDIVNNECYSEMLKIQELLNAKLRNDFEIEKVKGREHLARFLTSRVGQLIDELNATGYSFAPCDYSGDINFENSEQSFSNGADMGEGIIIHFHGYSVQATWEGSDKYA